MNIKSPWLKIVPLTILFWWLNQYFYPLTDGEVLLFGASNPDRVAWLKEGTTEYLGRYHGVPLMVSYPCGDLCPMETVRFIYLDTDTCAQVGGMIRPTYIPSGLGGIHTTSCFPRILLSTHRESVDTYNTHRDAPSNETVPHL